MKAGIISILCVAFCLIVGYVSGLFQSEAMSVWYPTLNKSALTPPGVVFPIVWTILYICIGLALAYILIRRPERRTIMIIVWSWQLFLNFLWSILFFYMRNPLLGFIDLLLLDITVISFISFCFDKARFSSIMFMPYMMWLLLASYLNAYVVVCN